MKPNNAINRKNKVAPSTPPTRAAIGNGSGLRSTIAVGTVIVVFMVELGAVVGVSTSGDAVGMYLRKVAVAMFDSGLSFLSSSKAMIAKLIVMASSSSSMG